MWQNSFQQSQWNKLRAFICAASNNKSYVFSPHLCPSLMLQHIWDLCFRSPLWYKGAWMASSVHKYFSQAFNNDGRRRFFFFPLRTNIPVFMFEFPSSDPALFTNPRIKGPWIRLRSSRSMFHESLTFHEWIDLNSVGLIWTEWTAASH